MTDTDVEAVVGIELASNQHPWPEEAFRRELKLPFSTTFVARAETEPRVRGFMVLWVIRGEVHILDFAVHPEFRRQGVGSRLIERALEFTHDHDGRMIYLEVRRSNTAAQALYEGFGFEQVSVREGYYNDNQEDALVMVRRL